MQRRFRQVLTSLKEHTCVSYAKIATIGGFCDLDLLIVKATSPDDLPLPDRYVRDLLKIFSISPSSYRTFSLSFTRRFGKTQCWRVALKCLMLLHRLLRALPDNTQFRSELLWSRSNGLLSLYPCQFRDCSSSAYEYYTIFIRSYAQLLDEALDCWSIHSPEEEVPESLPDKMAELSEMLEVLPQVQSLIDRVIDCRPTGAAARNFVVQSAMKHIIRDSFICYTTYRKEIVVLLDHLIQMPYRSCIEAFGIYKKAAVQAIQLCEFYDWCKSMGLCGYYEYPFIDRIPHIQIRALENFLNGMWQLTNSSSPPSPRTSTIQSSLSSREDNSDKQLVRSEVHVGNNWAKFEKIEIPKILEKEEEMEPLIQFEIDNNVGWEAILEASITPSSVIPSNCYYFYPNGYGHGCGYTHNSADGSIGETNGWQMQVYNPCAVNPFNQPHNLAYYNGSFPSNTRGDFDAERIAKLDQCLK